MSWAFTIMTGATFGLGPWLALPMCVIQIRKAAEESNNGELAQFTATRIQRLDVQMLPVTTTEPTTTTPP